MAGLRFGVVSESVRAGRAWLDFARQVENSGIDVLLLRDHFSSRTVRAAAGAVQRPGRRGGGDHPAAAGHAGAVEQFPAPRDRRPRGGQHEHGSPAGGSSSASGRAGTSPNTTRPGSRWARPGQRLERLDASLGIIRQLLAGTPVHHTDGVFRIGPGLDLDVLPLRPDAPRLLVGAGGPRMLQLATEHADIVGGCCRRRSGGFSRQRQSRGPAADRVRGQARRAPRGGQATGSVTSRSARWPRSSSPAGGGRTPRADHRPARLGRGRGGDGVGDADDLRRQPGVRSGLISRPGRGAVRPDVPLSSARTACPALAEIVSGL